MAKNHLPQISDPVVFLKNEKWSSSNSVWKKSLEDKSFSFRFSFPMEIEQKNGVWNFKASYVRSGVRGNRVDFYSKTEKDFQHGYFGMIFFIHKIAKNFRIVVK